jgi:hypothetical protein
VHLSLVLLLRRRRLEADFVDKFDRPETQISGLWAFFQFFFNEPRRREEREEGRGGRRVERRE